MRVLRTALPCLLLLVAFSSVWAADSAAVLEAQGLKKAGKPKEAIAVLEKALATSPDDARVHYVLAWLYSDQGDKARVVEHFRRAITLAPNSTDAREAQAALKRLGSGDAAQPGEGGPTKAASDKLDSLRRPFQRDPASAYEMAWHIFQEPRRKGDLEGMMGIVRVVGPEAGSGTRKTVG